MSYSRQNSRTDVYVLLIRTGTQTRTNTQTALPCLHMYKTGRLPGVMLVSHVVTLHWPPLTILTQLPDASSLLPNQLLYDILLPSNHIHLLLPSLLSKPSQ